MLNAINEKLLAKIISVGSAATTILIVSGSVTDPVNAPKLVVLGVTALAGFGVLISSGLPRLIKLGRVPVVLSALFVLSAIISVIASRSPLSQNIYGSYGRNNGFVTYLFLAIIFTSALAFTSSKSFEMVIKSLLLAGLINIAYCLWVISFGDFIGWSNPYGNILGTLGNPNFIGSFLGIFLAAYLSFALSKSVPKFFKYSLIVVLPVTALEIYKSNAIQGRVVAALGVGILGFLLVRSKFGKLISIAYVAIGLIFGLFALLGALQIGPLTKYIYKTSVSLRGQYWLAGWNTGESHPLTGVGMDSFGDWYRRSRDLQAIDLPGVNTVVNAAHNVPLDMFAFGGWPLFICYLGIMTLAGFSAIRIMVRRKEFDPIFSVLLTSWAGYQLQSIISINQIGLAVWGWLLSGTLIAYEKATRGLEHEFGQHEVHAKKSSRESGLPPSAVLAGVGAGIVGLVFALPPMISDAKWRSAQVSRTAAAIEGTMESGFYNLPNSTKYLNNIQALESSSLFDLSHNYALQAVAWNPESFELWKVLYLLNNSSTDEKSLALLNMKRLDPLNPDVTSIQ